MRKFLNSFPFLKTILKTITLVIITVSTTILTFVFILFILMMATLPKDVKESEGHLYGTEGSEYTLLSIKINGVILGSKDEMSDPLGLFEENATYGYEIKKQLYKAAKKDAIKGIILEINSPGGTIYGSNAISDGVTYYREKTGKPVIAHISGLAASGAYWSAVSADHIIADVGSMTGSIGVIFGPFKYYDNPVAEDGGFLMGGIVTQNGIDTMYITAGKSKDFGNPFRRLTDEEIRSLQRIVNNEYDMFVNYVSNRRGIEGATIREKIGALIYDNKTAKELKLIDSIGNKEDSYMMLAKKAKLKEGEYEVIEEKKPTSSVKELLSSMWKQDRGTSSQFESCVATKTILAFYGDVGEICK
jgi:protease IV